MPNGDIAFSIRQQEPIVQTQKLITFEKQDIIKSAFSKIICKLPEGCLYPEHIKKLSESFPLLPFSCANCFNAEKLILKVGFYPHALPLCKECSNSNCANTPPLQRMRKILFRKCELLER
jgi:hypothetical protein